MSTSAVAARLHQHGDPLRVESVDLLEPGQDEVLVNLAYAAINPVDRYVALGRVAPDSPLPRTLGSEAVGTVDGRPVLVCGHQLGRQRDGLWATAAVVPRGAVSDLPAGVDLKQAAAIGVVGVTAWTVVTRLAGVTAADRVLVLGASGGVGSTAISLVRSIGAQVWGQTEDPKKRAWISARGASRVVVTDSEHLVEEVRALRPTVVLDPLGGQFTAGAITALEPFGRLIIFGTSAGLRGEISIQELYRKELTVLTYSGLIEPPERFAAGVTGALGALADGRLRISVDSVMPLAEVNEALARQANREVLGKLVLDLS